MYYPGRKEGQFDIGLVNRWGNVQAGAFGSFKYLNFKDYQTGGGLGQAAFLVDYIFGRGRIGLFGTKGFKNYAILNSVQLGPQSFIQTYARVVDQTGVNALVGVWGNAYLEGNLGYLRRHARRQRPSGRHAQTGAAAHRARRLHRRSWASTRRLLNCKDSGRVVFGLQVGNYIHPKEYGKTKTPVPMDVPRVRYELLTRRVGNSAAGGRRRSGPGRRHRRHRHAGRLGSYDPDGDALTYQWTQIAGAGGHSVGADAAQDHVHRGAGQTYIFRLTVTDTGGLPATATTRVIDKHAECGADRAVRRDPEQITAGQSRR